MHDDAEAGDGLLRRADLEVELARFILRLSRHVDDEASEVEGAERVLKWFQTASVDLIHRAAPDQRAFLIGRLQEVARSLAGIDIGTFDIDAAALTFELTSTADPFSGATQRLQREERADVASSAADSAPS